MIGPVGFTWVDPTQDINQVSAQHHSDGSMRLIIIYNKYFVFFFSKQRCFCHFQEKNNRVE